MTKKPRVYQLWRKTFGKNARAYSDSKEHRYGLSCDWKKYFSSLKFAKQYAETDYSALTNALNIKFSWKEQGKDNYGSTHEQAIYWIALLDIEE